MVVAVQSHFSGELLPASTSALVVADVHSTCKDTSVNFPLTIHPLPEAGMVSPQACVGKLYRLQGLRHKSHIGISATTRFPRYKIQRRPPSPRLL